MEYEQVQGESMPKLGFGTWSLRGDQCYRSMLSALELGYRHIDTADEYRNQREIGRAIRDSGIPRDEIFLTTKVWPSDLRPEDVLRSCAHSLEALQMDTVDLLLIHWPSRNIPLKDTLGAFNQLKQAGRTRHIGVSNFDLALLRKAQRLSDAPIFCDQVLYHLYQDQRQLVRYCQEQDVMLTAYTPLARGRVLRDAAVREIAERHGMLPAQIALRWLAQQAKVFPIPKAASRDHQQTNLELFDFQLSELEMQSLSKLCDQSPAA